jgi:hypothetical protein
MMSPSSSFFSIHKNASQGMYPTPQLELPKIFNIIFEASLTKGGLGTSSCPCPTSFKQYHSNATFFLHKQLPSTHSTTKLIKHHSRCEHSLPNDFDVKDLFHKLKDL